MASDRIVKVSFIGDAGSLTRAAAASEAAFSKVGSAASKAASSVTSNVAKIGSSAATIGKGIAIGAAGLAIGGAAIGTALFKVGESFDAAYDKIRIGTGATGAQLKGFEDSVKKVFSSVPTDLSKASDAFVALQQRTQGAGVPLETVTKQMLELSRITKTDLAGNIGATQDAFQAFGITLAQQPKFLDELFIASQKTGVAVADIASSVADAQPQLSSLGFNFEQSAALAGVLGKAGSSLSDVMPALSKAMAVAAKQGKDAGTVFSDTFTAIKNAPNATKAAGIALDVFGAKAGPKLATLIREGKLSYQDLLKTMQAGGDTIIGAGKDTQDFGEKLQLFKNRLAVAFEPIAIKLFDAIGAAMDKVGPPFARGVNAIIRGLSEIRSGFLEGVHAEGFIGVLQKVGNLAHSAVEAVHRAAAGFLEAFTSFRKFGEWDASGPFEKLGVIAAQVFGWIKANGPAIFNAIKEAGEKAFSVIVTAFSTVADILANKVFPVIKKVFDFLVGHKEVLVGALVGVVAGFVAFAIATQALAVEMEQLAVAEGVALAPILAIGLAVAAAVAGVIYAYKHFDNFRHVVDATGRFLRDDFLPVLKDIGSWLKDVFAPAIADAARWLVSKLTPAFKAVGDFVKGTVIPALAKFGEFFEGKILPAIEKFASFFVQKILPAVAKIVVALAKFYLKVEEVFFKVLKVVVPIIIKIDTLFLKLELTLAKLYIKFAEVIGHIIVKAVELGIKVGKAVADVVKWFVDFGKKVFDVGKDVVGAIAGVVEKFVDVAKNVGEKVGEIVGFIVGIGKRIASEAGDIFGVVKTAITDAKDWVGDRVTDIVDFVKAIGSRIGEFASDLFFDVKLAITLAKNWVLDKVDDIVGFFKGIGGRIKDALVGVYDFIIAPFQEAFAWIQSAWHNSIGAILDKIQTFTGISSGGFSGNITVQDLRAKGLSDKEIKKILGDKIGLIGSFGDGGIVGGSKGAPQLVLAHGGELVLPLHKMSFPKALEAVQKRLGKLPQFNTGGIVGGAALARQHNVLELAPVRAARRERTDGGGNTTIIIQLDGKTIAQTVVNQSRMVGGLPIRIRAAS